MVPIFDIAKEAGVSVVTVSRLMNNPKIVSTRTAEKILKAMEKFHYQPSQIARSLVGKRTNTIGVIMPDIKNTFFNSWFRFIEEYANSHGFNLLLSNTDEDPDKEMRCIKLLQSQRVDGVIIAAHARSSVEYLLKTKMRFILFDRVYDGVPGDFVTTDHYHGAFNATEYLINLGHRKIAIYHGPGELYPDIERTAGFRDAMKKHHVKIEESLVLNCEFEEEKARKTTLELLKRKEKPTAIFPFNGLMSKGVIKALREANLSIPDDISLLSFDEIPGQDIFTPAITHVIQPINTLGKDVILALIETIKTSATLKKVRIVSKPKLVIGNSCKKLNMRFV